MLFFLLGPYAFAAGLVIWFGISAHTAFALSLLYWGAAIVFVFVLRPLTRKDAGARHKFRHIEEDLARAAADAAKLRRDIESAEIKLNGLLGVISNFHGTSQSNPQGGHPHANSSQTNP
ncbi:hypothetical protein [Burkholderia stagnalis]|uniref:hypothetical protein n=1 Tax=Burkholderia stagnalis TaxID=1503054 RepID=UPI0012D8AA8A|nr:hypothetical protein [Burkholderia stagnalis]